MKIRLSLIYFSMFAFIGIHMPFWPVWLESKGISPSEIAVLTALSFALKIVFTPIVSNIVDVNGKKRQAVILLSFGLFISCLLFFRTDGFIPIFLLTTAAFACWSPIMSLCESLTTVSAKQYGLDYGKIRLWGSISFMIVAIFSGTLLEKFGEPVLLWAISGAACLLFVASLLLPKTKTAVTKNKNISPKLFFKSKWFVCFLLAATLIQGSHATYYTFGTIHWRAAGLSDQLIGLLWGSSIAFEIVLFAYGRPLLNKIGPINILILGGFSATIRWALIGSTDNIWFLLIAQSLHAFSFGASHLAAMMIISDRVDDTLSATGQGIYSAFIMGLGMGIFVLLSGPIYSEFQDNSFYIMSAVSTVGLCFLCFLKSHEMNKIDGKQLPVQKRVPVEMNSSNLGFFGSYARFVITYRFLVIVLLISVTAFLIGNIGTLKIDTDPDIWAPQDHPYVQTTRTLEKVFGGRNVTIVGIVPKQGNIYQPEILAKIQHIQRGIEELPQAIRHNILSLAARKVKYIKSTPDGMEVMPMMEKIPQTPAEIAQLKSAVATMPIYINSLVSQDESAAAVIADFKTDKSHPNFSAMIAALRPIVEREKDATVDLYLGGLPMHGSWLEFHMKKMPMYFGIAVLIIMAIQFWSFRSLQGMLLPLLTSSLSVLWGLGLMGMLGVHMDPINSTTPILIMALAAGHAIQILKRYYEEYYILQRRTSVSPLEANIGAVIESLVKVGPVMITAGLIAAITFFSLYASGIVMVQHFGVFAGCGVLSALVLELTLIPALRSVLPAPKIRETTNERRMGILDRFLSWMANNLAGKRAPWFVGGAAVLLGIAAIGLLFLQVDNSVNNRHKPNSEYRIHNAVLNQKLSGTNSIIFLVETPNQDGIKDPKVLQGISELQTFLEFQPYVGKTQSLVDLIKRMNQAMHGDNIDAYTVPDTRDLITQYLFLYSLSGEPQDFDSFVDNDYKKAAVWVFLKTDSSSYAISLYNKAQTIIDKSFPPGVTVRMGGSLPQNIALNEVVTQDKFQNMGQMAIIVFILSSIAFRSLVAGLFVVTPLLAVILVNFGLMGWVGIPVDISSTTSAAMAIGIGADYEIYLLYRFREELVRSGSVLQATTTSLLTSGKAILFVALSIIGGYAILQVSDFTFYSTLSTLVITTMSISALFALFFLRALMITFKPRFIFGDNPGTLFTKKSTTAEGGV